MKSIDWKWFMNTLQYNLKTIDEYLNSSESFYKNHGDTVVKAIMRRYDSDSSYLDDYDGIPPKEVTDFFYVYFCAYKKAVSAYCDRLKCAYDDQELPY